MHCSFNYVSFFIGHLLPLLSWKLRLGCSNPDFKNPLRTYVQTEVVIESLAGFKKADYPPIIYAQTNNPVNFELIILPPTYQTNNLFSNNNSI